MNLYRMMLEGDGTGLFQGYFWYSPVVNEQSECMRM